MATITAFFATLGLLLPLLVIAAVAYRFMRITDPKRDKPLRHNQDEPTHILIVLGSGGHTAEMLAMLSRAVTDPLPAMRLNWKDFAHRTWVVGSGDSISAQRAKDFEDMATLPDPTLGMKNQASDRGSSTWELVVVPRAREIHQPLYTSPLSSLRCMKACYGLLMKHTAAGKAGDIDFPDIILCNGPATATIVVLTSVLLRFFDVRGCSSRRKLRTVYVESWARVKKLSLSGRLLKHVADRFLVQWPQLERAAGGRAEYIGVLV